MLWISLRLHKHATQRPLLTLLEISIPSLKIFTLDFQQRFKEAAMLPETRHCKRHVLHGITEKIEKVNLIATKNILDWPVHKFAVAEINNS